MYRKRVISWILIFAMVIGFAPINIYASDVAQKQEVTAESDFDFDESSGTIKKYNGTATDVVIPEKINGKAVTTVGKEPLQEKDLLQLLFQKALQQSTKELSQLTRLQQLSFLRLLNKSKD